MTGYRRLPVRDPAPDGDRSRDVAGASPPEAVVAEAAAALARDELLVHPTSTVYGIGAGSPAGDHEIARLKGRSPDRPFLRLAASVEALLDAHPEVDWDDRAERLADELWPGPLTLVLETGRDPGLAVRVDSDPLVRRVLETWGGTMSSTSLNRTGEAPARTPDDVVSILRAFPESEVPVLWLDAGSLPESPSSTLLSLRGERPRLLRRGAVSLNRIQACLGEPVEEPGVVGQGNG